MTDDPKLEIERKFLVTQLPADLNRYRRTSIAQGYVAVSDTDELRIRERSGEYTLTVKCGDGLSRREEELTLSADLHEQLWPSTEGRRVYKDRYKIPLHGSDRTVELDLYTQQLLGLRVAEVEFATENQARSFEPPAWLGREVTDDPAYKNRALAERTDLTGLELS